LGVTAVVRFRARVIFGTVAAMGTTERESADRKGELPVGTATITTNSLADNSDSGFSDIDQLAVNVVRGLAMDAPQKANSGHSGTAMALAPLAHVLFTRVMNHDPADPHWPDRDRFVLSAGHASILLYSYLFLTGYGTTLQDIESFRQWGSRTPGHPEVHLTAGVEVTTGPLGQGLANAVGMAMAERILRTRFGAEICDHRIYVIAGDGCMEEGISHEAASLAGHLGLGRLICIYDDNHITIDGPTELAYSDDRAGRFKAYGWHVVELGESANDMARIEEALTAAAAVEDRPSIILLRSHIGWPSPGRTDTKEAHGEPFGAEEIAKTKEILGLPPDRSFYVPDEVIDHFRDLAASRGNARRSAWIERLARFEAQNPSAAGEYRSALSGKPDNGWDVALPTFSPGESVATRQALKKCLNLTLPSVPFLVSGAADLTGNTGTQLDGEPIQSRDFPGGRQIAWGIREHAMGATMTGMALHGGVLPVGGTFFCFSDYMRPAIRLAALSQAHVVYSFTHDSVGLGEDGPTHQPVEHLASLRALPGLRLLRPADAVECVEAVRIALESPGPTALVLSRQGLPVLEETTRLAGQGVRRGAYALRDCDSPDVVLIGTGSEVAVCLSAADQLSTDGIACRVVSMPSWDLFEAQDPSYRKSVLPAGTPRLAVEAGASLGWERYADATVCIDRFGASAPGPVVMEKLGLSPDNVARRARELIGAYKGHDISNPPSDVSHSPAEPRKGTR
jgi:transketolase